MGGTPKSPADSIFIQLNPTSDYDINYIETSCAVIPNLKCSTAEKEAIKWILEYFSINKSGKFCTLWASWRKYSVAHPDDHLPRSKFWTLVKKHTGFSFPRKQSLDRQKSIQKK
jgi:hypothetical protein